MKYEFDAEIKPVPAYPNNGFVEPPLDIKKEFGKGRLKVVASFDGIPYRGSIVPMKGCYMLGIKKEIMKSLGKSPGDMVHVVFEEDKEARTVEIPNEIKEVLKPFPELEDKFFKMSYTHQKEWIQFINEAKKQETKDNRIAKLLAELENRK